MNDFVPGSVSINPANGELIARYPFDDNAALERALATAQAGFRAWAATPLAERLAAFTPAPGTRVDVLASDGEGLAGRTRVVVAGAEVLAIMRDDVSRGDGSGDALLLRVSTEQALEVTRALDFAREVRVVVRPATEP